MHRIAACFEYVGLLGGARPKNIIVEFSLQWEGWRDARGTGDFRDIVRWHDVYVAPHARQRTHALNCLVLRAAINATAKKRTN
jgi:hypothetical protein